MYVNETQYRILYAHTDKAGVVYYANYLMFFEVGRSEYMRALGRSYADFEREGFLLTVAEATCKYLGPARYDDLITIRTSITRVRRTRLDFAYDILDPTGRLICQGTTVLACIDAQTMRPREIPESFLKVIAPGLPA